MGVRDEELKRLIHYAKAMSVRVTIYQKPNKDASAQWSLDGTQIEVYAGKGQTKTETLLDLIHELGHHVWFIHEKDRLPDLKFDEAITRENMYETDPNNPTPKHLRKKIWDVELAGTAWWDVIYKDTNMKFPLWKLEAAKEFDMWMYEEYYETGVFPKGMRKRKKGIEIRRKHRKG